MNSALVQSADSLEPNAWGVLRSLFSGYALQISGQAGTFLTRLVLARIILPDAWGVYGEALVIVSLADALRELNLCQWAITERTDIAWTRVGRVLTVATVLMVLLLAPLIPFTSGLGHQLPLVVAIMSLTLIPRTFTIPAEARLNAQMRLGRLLRPQAAATVVFIASGLVLGITFRSAWSLALASVAQAVTYAVLLRRGNRGIVTLGWSGARAWSTLYRARHFVGLGLTGLLFAQFDALIVGAVSGPTTAGFYLMAYWLMLRTSSLVEVPLMRVLLPVYARSRDDPLRLAASFRRSTVLLKLVETPIYFTILLNAHEIVSLLLGERWAKSASLLVLLTMYPLLSPLASTGWEVARMAGRADAALYGFLAQSAIFLGGAIALGRTYGVLGVVLANYLVNLTSLMLFVLLSRLMGRGAVFRVVMELAAIYVVVGGTMGLTQFLVSGQKSRLVVDCAIALLIGLVAGRQMWRLARAGYNGRDGVAMVTGGTAG